MIRLGKIMEAKTGQTIEKETIEGKKTNQWVVRCLQNPNKVKRLIEKKGCM